ncbi:MAG: hypothetical protein Q8N96_07530 [Methylovulum sp.]|nr:hypothetical protein [Methylovulum sp.]
MPHACEHIDAIARKKQRDVLFLTFHSKKSANVGLWDGASDDWEKNPVVG